MLNPPSSVESRELSDGVFSSNFVAQFLGVKPGCLKEWLKFIEPSIWRASGPGTRNLFSRMDIYKLCAFKELLGRGFKREAAKNILGQLR